MKIAVTHVYENKTLSKAKQFETKHETSFKTKQNKTATVAKPAGTLSVHWTELSSSV